MAGLPWKDMVTFGTAAQLRFREFFAASIRNAIAAASTPAP